DGDWNVDFTVGRIPVSDTNVLHQYLQTMYRYEEGGTWRTNVLVVDAGGIYFGQANAFESTISNGIHVLRTTNRSEVVESVSLGRGSIVYFGHGSHTYYGESAIYLHRNDIYTLQETNEPSVFISAGCRTGHYGDPYSESISEAMITQVGVGAAVFGSVMDLPMRDTADVLNAIGQAIYVDKVHCIGDAFYQSMHYYLPRVRSIHPLLLFGDPAMIINPE
ncbi:MAG: hypothetical protein KDL10_07625, partial [Kiritimatiellae bacterium]|nr:hypothetical protein [Kiritimatiellia bacterium]